MTFSGLDKRVSKVVAEPRSLGMVRYGESEKVPMGMLPRDILLIRSTLKGAEEGRQ